MSAEGSTRSHVAVVLACLAACAAMLLGDDEVPDPIARQQPAAQASMNAVRGESSDARRATSWMDSSKPPDDGHPAPANRLSDVESLDADASIAPLIAALVAEDVKVRLAAVTSLTIVGGDQAAAALTTVALTDADPAIRQEAVYALGEMGGEQGFEVLKHALFDPDVSVREAAVDAFADIGGEKSALALTVVLKDADASLRAEVVHALGEIGGQAATRLLRQAAMDEQRVVREAAADLLAELSGVAVEDGMVSTTR
jgi:HEAT repeat protein